MIDFPEDGIISHLHTYSFDCSDIPEAMLDLPLLFSYSSYRTTEFQFISMPFTMFETSFHELSKTPVYSWETEYSPNLVPTFALAPIEAADWKLLVKGDFGNLQATVSTAVGEEIVAEEFEDRYYQMPFESLCRGLAEGRTIIPAELYAAAICSPAVSEQHNIFMGAYAAFPRKRKEPV